MKDKFDKQEFYDLMQSYRHASVTHQNNVVKAFEEIKTFIRKDIEETSTDFALWIGQNLKKNKGKDVDKLWDDYKKIIEL